MKAPVDPLREAAQQIVDWHDRSLSSEAYAERWGPRGDLPYLDMLRTALASEGRRGPKVFATADDIDAAIRTIRGEVTRDEATIMAAAACAASSIRSGLPVEGLSEAES